MMLMTVLLKLHRFTVRPLVVATIAMVLVTVLSANISYAAETVYNVTADGIAIGGYDPVAYVVDGGPRPGDANISLQWSGAEWRFTSEANRILFENAPERYAPVYGGWCAMAMAGGDVVEVDFINAWSLNGGRVYLNVDAGIKKRWQRGASRFIPKADKEWPQVQLEILSDRANIFRKSQLPELYQ